MGINLTIPCTQAISEFVLQQQHQSLDRAIRQLDPYQAVKLDNYSISMVSQKKGIIFNNQWYYEGQIRNHMAYGHGYFVYEDGPIYEGEFKNNQPHGQGLYKSDKIQFLANWIQGKPKSGQLKLQQKRYFVRKLELEEKNGYIEIQAQEKFNYCGQIALNNGQYRYEGEGRMEFNSGAWYEGQWQNGKMHGKGLYTWPNSIQYEGYYHHGSKHGKGKIIESQNLYEVGIWVEGKRKGIFKKYQDDMLVFEEDFDHRG